MRQAKRHATKIRPKPSKAAFSVVFFSNFDKYRPEVADDVISGVAVYQVGMDVMWNLAILCLTGAELLVSLPVGSVLRTYLQYSLINVSNVVILA